MAHGSWISNTWNDGQWIRKESQRKRGMSGHWPGKEMLLTMTETLLKKSLGHEETVLVWHELPFAGREK